MITHQEYFEQHIPHRVNLLITFRERFKGLPDEKGYYVRDLFRCSKDSSLMMIRFFLSELGVKLPRDIYALAIEKEKDRVQRVSQFQLLSLSIPDIEKDSALNQDLIDALGAANRAVAHINNDEVNHRFENEIDDEILFRVIDYVEDKIIANIYKSRIEYDRVMKLDSNNMHRDRLKIYK